VLGGVLVNILWFGTDPQELTSYWDVGPPYQMTGMLPNTRYYWYVVETTYTGEGPVQGPMWTFTTSEAPVPVESNTWGRIKSLYE